MNKFLTITDSQVIFFSKAQGDSGVILAEDTEDLVIRDSPRTIPLVVNHTYTISCEGEWFQNGVAVPSSSSGGAYVSASGQGSRLHFDPFRENLTGDYTCQFSGGDTFNLNIFAGIYVYMHIMS